MHTIRERLGWTTDIEAQQKVENTFDQILQEKLRTSNMRTEQDEKHDRKDKYKRGVSRMSKSFQDALDECVERTGCTPAEWSNRKYTDEINHLIAWNTITPENAEGWCMPDHSDRAQYLTEMTADLRENFMYTEYLRQLFDESIEALGVSYASYSLVIALRAAMIMLATRPHACELLGVTADTRNAAVVMWDRERIGLVSRDSVDKYVEHLIVEVPGIWSIADMLLVEYSNAVTVERQHLTNTQQRIVDTPLPTDPDDGLSQRQLELLNREHRMRRAVIEYETGDGSIRDIARKYTLDNTELGRRIKELGKSRPRGGDRKG